MEPFETKPVSDSTLDEATRSQIGQLRTSKVASMMQTLGEFYRNNKLYVWAILLAIVVIGVLAFFAFRPNKTQKAEANVAIVIDVPETVPSDTEVIYKIRVENKDREGLEQMGLEIVYPDGFNYVSSVPNASNISGTILPVPDLQSGQSATLFVKIKARGAINDEKKLIVKLRYKFKNFGSEFIKTAEQTVRLVASDVALDFSGPAQATNAEIVSYTLKYRNNSDNEISNARIQLTYPQGFTFAKGSPEPNLSNNIWTVGSLKPDASGTIEFQGSFQQAQPGVAFEFKAVLQSLDQQGNYFDQATSSFITSISTLPLLVTQEVEGNNKTTIRPGDQLRYKINYQNNATVVASGVSIVFAIDSSIVDLGSIKAEGGQVNNSTVTWNATGIPEFERLNPSEKGTVSLSFKVKNPAVNDGSKNQLLKTAIKVKSDEYQTYLPGNGLELKLETIAELDSGVAFVSGSKPPKVGTQTKYQVTLSLSNTTNDVTGGTLTAFIPLPAGAFDKSSVNSKEAANVTFDASTGKLTWKVGTLGANAGSFNPKRELSFNLTINPTASQAGNNVTLVKTINFSGTDGFTTLPIQLKTADVTTSDSGNSEGRVQD